MGQTCQTDGGSHPNPQVAAIPNLSNPVHFVPVDFASQQVDEELAKVADYDPKATRDRNGWPWR